MLSFLLSNLQTLFSFRQLISFKIDPDPAKTAAPALETLYRWAMQSGHLKDGFCNSALMNTQFNLVHTAEE